MIGEATRRLSPELRTQHAEIPWTRIVGMRNILVHDYFAVDIEAVWRVVEAELPELKRKVTALLEPRDA